MRLIYAMLLGFILDLIFGDPHGLIHPVQIIGWFIDKLKKGMQHMIYGCSYEEVREKEIERKAGVEKTAGFFLMLFIVAGTFAVVYGILYVANLIHPVLRFCLETFFIYQILATKSLKTESMKVYKKLKEGDLIGARKEVSYLVGRDTENLDESEVAKADVETQVYTEFNEQFQAVAWIILLLLLTEMLILERKNPLFRNIHLFSNKK
jgi:adenosylcobinamide-phosphate synthase